LSSHNYEVYSMPWGGCLYVALILFMEPMVLNEWETFIKNMF